jgi:hypothetical protein
MSNGFPTRGALSVPSASLLFSGLPNRLWVNRAWSHVFFTLRYLPTQDSIPISGFIPRSPFFVWLSEAEALDVAGSVIWAQRQHKILSLEEWGGRERKRSKISERGGVASLGVKYLGSRVQSNENTDREIGKRNQAGWGAWKRWRGWCVTGKIPSRLKEYDYDTTGRDNDSHVARRRHTKKLNVRKWKC